MLRLPRHFLPLVLAIAWLSTSAPSFAAGAVVHAVLFYSPSCPHCHDVMENDLPPLMDKYGEQLDIIGINTSHPDGQALYQSAVAAFAIPRERLGVPALIIGDRVLVGSVEIPQQLPGLIEEHLAAGGVAWPAIPGLAEVVATTPVEPTAETVVEAAPAAEPDTGMAESNAPTGAAAGLDAASATVASDTVADRFRRDVVGNSLSVVVLAGMVAVVAASFRRSTGAAATPAWQHWAIPALVVGGLLISAYMAFVETTGAEAVCGPVGDCNTVQQSSYALLFGVLPVGVLGLAGYAALGIAWLAAHLGRLSFTPLVLMAFGGTLFSIYLTFVEPFVIGATCIWCLSSAVVITLILLLALRRAPLAT